jgi:hypothetical protein
MILGVMSRRLGVQMPKCPNCAFSWGKKQGESNRSNPQNRYLHGVVLPIMAEYTGYDQSEMKAVLKFKFKVKHTSDLSTAEFEKFLSDVRMWAAKNGCNIPEPGEVPVLV